jgi:glycosyltransferase involved in cell wall biosynthesis
MLVVSSDTYPPTRVDVRILLAEELGGRGHRIDWLLQSEAECKRPYVAKLGTGAVWVGATDTGSSRLCRIRRHVLGIANDFKLFGRLKSGDYDAIQVKDKFLSGLLAIMASRIYRVKYLYWLSWPFPEASLTRARDGTARYPLLYLVRGYFFKVLLYRILLPTADHVFVQSEQMKRDLAAEGIAPTKMTAVPMGIRPTNADPRESLSGRGRIVGERHCVLYLGTLARVRRIDFLVRVLARVRVSIPDAKLYLVGRGDEPKDEQVIIDESVRLGVENAIVYVGQRTQSEAFEYVMNADVCVSPFYPTPILNSTSPTKLIEYMALGKAVVANDHPEQKQVIGESGGGLCVPYDERAFADAIVTLLNNPDMAGDMGRRGKSYALEHRSYSAIARTVEETLLRVVRT